MWPRIAAVVDLHWLVVSVTRGGPAMRERTTPMPMSDHVFSVCVSVCLCVCTRVLDRVVAVVCLCVMWSCL